MLKQRIVIAAVGIPVLLTLCLLQDPLYMILFATVIAVVGVWEYYFMLKKIGIEIFALLISVFTVFLCCSPIITNFQSNMVVFIALTGIFIFLLSVSALFIDKPMDPDSKDPRSISLINFGMSIFVLVFYSVLFALILQLRTIDKDGGRYFLFILFVVMSGDTCAYFVGKYKGKHHLAPSISPSKTWEGVIGNIMGNIIGGGLYFILIFRSLSFTTILLLSISLGIIALLSDLIISYLKRAAGTKDSGVVFPGHGGVLDRTDSILFPTMLFFIYIHYATGMGLL